MTTFDDELKKLVEDMFESMYAARGVGLAAPQIGISKRIAVVDVTFKEDPAAKLVLINPVIIQQRRPSAEQRRLPEHSGISRGGHARQNRDRTRAGSEAESFSSTPEKSLLARAFLHETDHLNGKLYISHISALKRDLIKRKIKKMVKAGEW